MNARRLTIGIRSVADRSSAIRQAMRRVARGDLTAQEPTLYFETVDEIRRILTAKRLELLLAIARYRPASVRKLAGLVKRDYKNISTDVALLERLGLVSLETPKKGRSRTPTVPYDEIHVTIQLRPPHEVHAA